MSRCAASPLDLPPDRERRRTGPCRAAQPPAAVTVRAGPDTTAQRMGK